MPPTLRFLVASPSLSCSPLSRLLSSSRSICAASVPTFAFGRARRGKGGLFTQRREKSGTSPREEESGIEKGEKMEGNDQFAFNKRRAEGMDKSKKGRALELKARKLNPVSTTCYVQIMGTGMDTQDTSPSILLFFDKQRFIFNAGEGLQRYCSEHKIKLSKIDHIFLTRVCSETAGGLPGLVLTLAGMGDEGMSVNIWGPSDLDFLLGAMRSFIPRKSMLHAHSFGLDATSSSPRAKDGSLDNAIVLIDDEVVRISSMFVRPTNPKISVDSDPGEFLRPGDLAVVYVCELPEVKGKFDPVKAASLGLRPGPKYRDLQLGKSVKSDSLDIMVNPSDVLGPSLPGPIVLIVDCPTVFHTHQLFSLSSLNCYYKESGKVVNCIIHLGPSVVTSNAEYKQWMSRFGEAQHIMAGHEIKNMEIPILQASARVSSRLNYLCPQIFPSSGFWPNSYVNDIPSEEKITDLDAQYEVISAENLLKFHLRPISHLGLDRSAIPNKLTREHIINEILSEIPEIKEISQQISLLWQESPNGKMMMPPVEKNASVTEESWLKQCSLANEVSMEKRRLETSEDASPPEGSLRKRFRDYLDTPIPPCLKNVTREEMELVFLGTGSSQPSKYRNVSSIYVNLFDKGSVLLDCGEGTLGQLKRRFGVKGADEAVKKLRFIWVSHIHADHHTGLARILALRSQLLRDVTHEPLLVIGPRPLERFLNAYAGLEDLNMQFIDCRQTMRPMAETVCASGVLSGLFAPGSQMESFKRKPGNPNEALDALDRLKMVLSDAGLESLYSVPVRHCPEAFGVVLEAKDRVNRIAKVLPGWKLVYSGDTRPCPALIEAAKDATILIHEATFEDSMTEEAITKNHSTTKEAIGVGVSAGVYRIILTHFSQRYPKIPVVEEVDIDKTCIAFDLMSVNLADLPALPKVLPHLKLLFKSEMVADEELDEVQESVV